jgi:low temperature requirement protein LtrA
MTPSVEEAERHANNLELFLDLVFVFATTQVASSFAHDVSWTGFGHAMLVQFLVWWLWSQYTWAGAAVDLQASVVTRVLVLVTVPVALTMTVAIPDAFDDTGRWFGGAYFLVMLLVLSMQGVRAWSGDATRLAFLRYGPPAAIAPLVVAVGGFASGSERVAIWVAGAAFYLFGAFRGAAGEWVLNPVHFAERHALFVIIPLG